jgi:hypothetical protein
MRKLASHLPLVFGSIVVAVVLAGCSQGPDAPPPASPPGTTTDALLGDGGLPGFPDAGACAPTVTAGPNACSIDIGGTTCDCTDATCIHGAIAACAPGLGGGGGVGIVGWDGALPPLPPIPPLPPAMCVPSAIDQATQQLCNDLNAWLAKQGLPPSLGCTAIGAMLEAGLCE